MRELSAHPRPAVSVVIPTFNRASLLPRALESALAQTVAPIEVIVVDDGSTDHTQQVLETYPEIQVVRLPSNRGGGTARNVGVEAATAAFIAFLDSDDEWLPSKLDRQLQAFQGRPDLGAVYCRFFAFDDRTGIRREQHPPLYRGMIRDVLLSGKCPRSTSLFMVRRSAFEGVGGFDVSLPGFQDTDLWIRMSEQWEFDAVDEPLAVVHAHGGNRVTTDVAARQEALDGFLGKWEDEMVGAMGTDGVAAYRRNQMAVALGARVLDLASKGERRQALHSLRDYLAVTGVRRPRQLLGLVVAVVGGGGAHSRIKGWLERLP